MKKALQLLVVLAMIFSFAHNPSVTAQVSFGIKGGLNLANWGGEDAGETKMRTGYHLGGFLELSLPGLLTVEGGLYFSEKGYKDKVITLDYQFISSYIDIPVVLKFKPTPLFHMYTGPQVSVLLNNTIKVGDEEETFSDGFSPIDLGWVLGAGISFPGGVRISAGYDLGLITHDENNDFKSFNRVIKISIGVAF